jgi:hypothetical protein
MDSARKLATRSPEEGVAGRNSSGTLDYITTGDFLKSKTLWIVLGTAVSTIGAYVVYQKFVKKGSKNQSIFGSMSQSTSGMSSSERAKVFIKGEIARLKNLTLQDA